MGAAENVFKQMQKGENVTNVINHGMDTQERMALMQQICKGPADPTGVVKAHFGDLEITCSEKTLPTFGKIRNITDAHKGSVDIYDRPAEAAMKAATGGGRSEASTRSEAPAPRKEAAAMDPAEKERQKKIEECAQSGSKQSLKTELAVCKALY
jgi:hypothetical protein